MLQTILSQFSKCIGKFYTFSKVHNAQLAIFLIILSFVVGFIPNDERRDDELLIRQNSFQTVLILSIIAVLPITADACLDLYDLLQDHINYQRMYHLLLRFILVSSYLIPNAYYYANQKTNNSQSVLCLNCYHFVCSVISVSALVGLNPHIPGVQMFLIYLSTLLGQVLTVYFNEYDYSGYIELPRAFMIITLLQLSWLLRSWFAVTYRDLGAAKVLDADELYTLYLLSALVVACVAFVAIEFSDDSHISGSQFRWRLYVQIAFSTVLSLIPGRTARVLAYQTFNTMEANASFVRYIAHEIRTPLNTVFLGLHFINSEIQTLSEGGPSNMNALNSISETMIDINDSCKVAITILNDLLTVDKLKAGKLVVELEEVNPLTVVAEACRPFKVHAISKGIGYEVQIDDESEWALRSKIKVDTYKFSQVLRNLISNALKFTPSGGSVLVRVSLQEYVSHASGKSSSTKDNFLRIDITDSGAGISAENQKKLFGQYVQFNAGKLQNGNGSGLGLWIAKGIMELHGGKISAHSLGEEMGSTFFVELPLIMPLKEGTINTADRGAVGRLFGSLVQRKKTNFPPANFGRVKESPKCMSPRAGDREVGWISKRFKSPELAPSVVINSADKGSVSRPAEHASSTKVDGARPHPMASIHETSDHDKSSDHDSTKIYKFNMREIANMMVLPRREGVREETSPKPMRRSSQPAVSPLSRSEFGVSPRKRAQSFAGKDAARNLEGLNLPSNLDLDPRGNIRVSRSKLSVKDADPPPSQNSATVTANKQGTSTIKLNKRRPKSFSNAESLSEIKEQDGASTSLSGGFNLFNQAETSSKRHTANPNLRDRVADGTGTIMKPASPNSPRPVAVHRRARSFSAGTSIFNDEEGSLKLTQLRQELRSAMKDPSSPKYSSQTPMAKRRISFSADLHHSSPSSSPQTYLIPEESTAPKAAPSQTVLVNPATQAEIAKSALQMQAQLPISTSSSAAKQKESAQKNDEKCAQVSRSSFKASEEETLQKPKKRISFSAQLVTSVHSLPNRESPEVSSIAAAILSVQEAMSSSSSEQDSVRKKVDRKGTPQWSKGLHICVVDDSSATRKVMRRLLQSKGHTITEAGDGKQLLDLMWEDGEHADIDAVLLDDNMPNMNGPEACKEMRRRGFRGLVIGVTGNTTTEDLLRFTSMGANAVLTKPLDLNTLRDTVDKHFSKQ